MIYKLKETEWAYVAGLIDADGCIQAPYLSRKTKNRPRSHRIEIHIIQRDLEIIEFLYEKFQGSVNLVSTKREDGRRHYYFRFMITGPRCADILKGTLPYLKLKKEQAELGIALQNIILPKGNSKPLSQDVFERRTSFAEKIKSLNSPVETECFGSLTKEMRQSELMEMKNRQSMTEMIIPPSI